MIVKTKRRSEYKRYFDQRSWINDEFVEHVSAVEKPYYGRTTVVDGVIPFKKTVQDRSVRLLRTYRDE